MNGQTIPSTGEPDVIVTDGENIRYGEKKKLSLTLPLLNVIVTNAVNEEEQDDTVIDAATTTATVATDVAVDGIAKQKTDDNDEKKIVNDSTKLEVSGSSGESNKMKKIYESDDTFIQAIFSQTIKSTTATPTDDEPSQVFDDAFKSSTKSSQDDTDTMDATAQAAAITSDDKPGPVDDNSESISKEPAAIYTYFHQTIEQDDDSPDLDTDLDKSTTDLDLDVDGVVVVTNESSSDTTCNPIHTTITTTTTVFTNDKIQINICTEVKDELSCNVEKDGGASYDNSLNNTSTAFASNEAISESEHSLTQLNSLESDVSVSLPPLPRALHISCLHMIYTTYTHSHINTQKHTK